MTNEVEFENKQGSSTGKYVWGDCEAEFRFCEHCGCVIYWWPIESPERHTEGVEMGINSRMMDPEELREVDRMITFGDLKTPLKQK